MDLILSFETTDTPLRDAADYTQYEVKVAGSPIDQVLPLAERSLVVNVDALAPGTYNGTVALVNAGKTKVAGTPFPFSFTIEQFASAPVPSAVHVTVGAANDGP